MPTNSPNTFFVIFTSNSLCVPNETVEKPLVRKMFIKISHNRPKNRQSVAQMLCGTPKTRCFSAFLSHFSKIIFEKRLIRQFQRLALPAWGGRVDSPRNGIPPKPRKHSKNAWPTHCQHVVLARFSLNSTFTFIIARSTFVKFFGLFFR